VPPLLSLPSQLSTSSIEEQTDTGTSRQSPGTVANGVYGCSSNRRSYRPTAHRQHRAFAAGSATMGPPHESPFCIGIYVEAEDAAAAALARLRSISFTHQMEISYSATSGTARLSIEITSGGVKSAASAKMPTIA